MGTITFLEELDTLYEQQCIQDGNTVYIHFGINLKNTITPSTSIDIAAISGVDFPNVLIRTSCTRASQAWFAEEVGYCHVNVDGHVAIIFQESNNKTRINFTIVYNV